MSRTPTAQTPAPGARRRGADWRAVVESSALPAELLDLVQRVVARTGLWASERADVAAELCAHFADGLERGRKPEELAAAFGDPVAAARLIRRGAIRKRPWAWHAWRAARTAAVVMALGAAAAYLVLLVRFVTASPNVSRDFLAELNAPAEAVPEGQRAWDAYLAALAELPAGVMSRPSADLVDLAIQPGPEADPALVARARELVASSAAGIESLRRAASVERLGFRINAPFTPAQRAAIERSGLEHIRLETVPGERPPALAVAFPTTTVLRHLSRLLAADAALAQAAGDGERLAADWRAMLAMGRHARESPVLISHLVALAIDGLAFESIARTLARRPELLSDERLRELAHLVASIPDMPPPAAMAGERMGFYDMVQRTYSDDGRGGGRLTPEGLAYLELLTSPEIGSWTPPDPGAGRYAVGPALLAMDVGRRRLVAEYDRVMDRAAEEARTPLWRRDVGAATRSVDALAADPLQRSRFTLIALLLPALDTGALAGDRHAMERDALAAALALELFRREHGRWPASLAELTPRWLPAAPIDRFVGVPMGYRTPGTAGGPPTIYGVGADLDDDAGVEPADGKLRRSPRFRTRAHLDAWRRADPAGFAREVPDGDWVLFPPPK
jgi:hypothetical protein